MFRYSFKSKRSLCIKIILTVVILLVAYLYLTYSLIFYRIDSYNLKPSNNNHVYTINNDNSPSVTYGAIGDSLTAGVGVNNYEKSYPYLVAKKIASTSTKVTHINYSYSGARTSNVIKDLLPKVILDKPDVITLLIGTNDVFGNVSQAGFRENYEKIVTDLKSQTTAKINIISIPILGSDSLIWQPHNLYFRAKVLKFNKTIKEIADKNDITYIDLTTPTTKYSSANSSYYSVDMLHPSALSYKYWSQIIYDHLDK